MKIVVSGSLGNISKPLTKELVKKGHSVTVISTKEEKRQEIEKIGATAAIGTMEDVDFLTKTFRGSDVVYTMLTNGMSTFFDPNADLIALMNQIGKNYKKAIEQSGVKRLVHLSSIGANMESKNGNLRFHYDVENILKQLPENVAVKFMRPAGFFTNIYRSVTTIKENNSIISNYGGDQKEPWVSPLDIATAIVEVMEGNFQGKTFRYVASDEVSPNKVATEIGKAIGNENLKWVAITDEELLSNMLAMGMNKDIAAGFVEMQASQGNGLLYEDYYQNQPILGKVKLNDFALEFANAIR